MITYLAPIAIGWLLIVLAVLALCRIAARADARLGQREGDR